jgi:hypothetical protein
METPIALFIEIMSLTARRPPALLFRAAAGGWAATSRLNCVSSARESVCAVEV